MSALLQRQESQSMTSLLIRKVFFDGYNADMGVSSSSRLSRVLDWLPAALSVAMIAAESTATMSADNTSRWLYPLWAHLFGPISARHWAEVHHLIRKTGHFVGYGGVSVAFLYGWLRTLHRRRGKYRPVWLRAAFLAVSCTLLIAILDEYHQSFLPSRTSSPIDVCIDLCGAITAQLLLLTWSRCNVATN
jgi:VanZ family protein